MKRYRILSILCLLALSVTVMGQQKQAKLLNVPNQPNTKAIDFRTQSTNLYNFNINTSSQAYNDFIFDGGFNNPNLDDSYYAFNYCGQAPRFASQTITDADGRLLLFIVDDYIYDSNGDIVTTLTDANYNISTTGNTANDAYGLHQDIIVTPKEGACNDIYYIFYTVQSLDGVETPKLYVKEYNASNSTFQDKQLNYTNKGRALDVYTNYAIGINNPADPTSNQLYILFGPELSIYNISDFDFSTNTFPYKTLSLNPQIKEIHAAHSINRPDMVVSSFNNDNYLLATSVHLNAPGEVRNHAAFFKIPKNYNAISQTSFDEHFVYINGYYTIGMELSPNKQYLYFNIGNNNDHKGIRYFDLSNSYASQSLSSITSNDIYTLALTRDYNHSGIELGRDNRLYAITNDGEITAINDPDNPTTTSTSNMLFSIICEKMNRACFTGNNLFPSNDELVYLFSHQIDQADYEENWPTFYKSQPNWSTIGSNETWEPGENNNPFGSPSGIVYLDDDFEIPSGKYIQIENMEFHFANDKKAIINIGSTLNLVNSKLSSADHCDQTTMWGGVLVKGDANADQSAANQGRFRMDAGSEVSNAVHAVKVESGAICQIYGGEIKNNVYGVYFNPYIHPQVPAYNASVINNATFETNKALNNGSPNILIRLNGVNGVDIDNCTLSNSRDNTVRADYRGQGLYTYNADFTMSDCDLNGFYYGAKVMGGSTPTILDCDFSNNLRGALMKGVLLADVRNNTFNGDYDFPIRKDELLIFPYPYEYYNYSLYVAGDGVSSAIHEIKGNAITNGRLGLLLYNTGESATQIKDNSFDNISGASNVSAAIVMGKNSNYSSVDPNLEGDEGTEFRCNSFSQNTYAMSIVDGNMRKYQGEHNASSGEEYAGNSFDHYGTSTERDFYVDASIASYLDIPLYEYYSHVEDTNHTYDIEFYSNNVIEEGKQFDYSSNDCLEDSGGGGIVIKGKSVRESIGDIETLDSEISLKSFELSELTDNGETYIMLSEVENASTTNSTEVASDLSELDGFISDEVTLTYMQNSATGEFDKAGALLANSPLPGAAKNEIDNMEMNSTLKTIIKAGQNGKNSREIKETEIAGLKQTRGLIVKEMVNRVITNDSLQSERNALITFLQNDNTFTSKIHLLNLYKAERNNAAIETCIHNLRTQIHSFDVDRLTEMENYLDLQEVLLTIDNGLFSMEDAVSQNMEFLQNLANTENVAGEIQAQVLLEETGNSEFLETIKLPEEIMDNKNMAIQSESENMTNDFESIIKVYPNPSSDYFSIEYALIDFSGNETIEIYSSNGRLIDRLDIPYAIGTFKFEQKLPAGNYIIKVGENYTQKLNIL